MCLKSTFFHWEQSHIKSKYHCRCYCNAPVKLKIYNMRFIGRMLSKLYLGIHAFLLGEQQRKDNLEQFKGRVIRGETNVHMNALILPKGWPSNWSFRNPEQALEPFRLHHLWACCSGPASQNNDLALMLGTIRHLGTGSWWVKQNKDRKAGAVKRETMFLWAV